jgi:cytochrome c
VWAVLTLLVAACSEHSNSPASKAGTQSPPPPGIWNDAHVPAGGVVPPAVQFQNPQGSGAADATVGGNLFVSMNCDGCHGGGASGWVGPSLIDGRWRYGDDDAAIFTSIYYGRPKGMPAYGGVIGAEGVWMQVAYLKSRRVPSVVPTTSYQEMDHAHPAATVAAHESTDTPFYEPTAASSAARTPEQMLAQYGCVACHATDRKVVGPSFKDVAAKYKGQPGIENTLAAKVKNGSSGVWGTVPMPPNPQIPDTDAHALVQWLLSLK